MTRILANDGLAPEGTELLQKNGFEVDTNKIEQASLAQGLKDYEVLIVRSATKVTRNIIEANPHLKLIVRAGVGIDNIDVDAAKEKGIAVRNTPKSSSLSVAEIVFAHIFSLSRFLHQSNRAMPAGGSQRFGELKKSYSKGSEVRGKTLGIIGLGRIGQEVARIGISLGMTIVAHDPMVKTVTIPMDHLPIAPTPEIVLTTTELDELIENADIISLHVPFEAGQQPLLSSEHFSRMKDGVIVINAARGGVVREADLVSAIDSGKVRAAALDVFENEPKPDEQILRHEKISYTPHIGASTVEGQERISIEVAETIIDFFNQK